MGAINPMKIEEMIGLDDEADLPLQDAGADGVGDAGGSDPPRAAASPADDEGPDSQPSGRSESDGPSPEYSEDPSDEVAPSTDTKNAASDEEFDAASMPATKSVSDDSVGGLTDPGPDPGDALNQLVEDPRYRSDREYTDYVTRQFERVYGTDGETDATGHLIVDGNFSRFEPFADRSSATDGEADGLGAASGFSVWDTAERPGASSRAEGVDEIESWLRGRRIEVAENSKPKTATDAVTVDEQKNPDIPELSYFKVEYFKKQPGAWESFNEALARVPDLSPNQRLIYAEIFAMEGGMTTHPGSGAASGITQDILDRAKEDLPGLEKVRTPDQLTVGQRAAIYPYYFDDVLRTVGGRRALDKIGNDEAAAALADTLFRFGRSRGTEIIQDAMNRVFRENGYPEMPTDGQMGPGTLAAHSYLAGDGKLAERLSYYLVNRRIEQLGSQKNKEEDRSNYFSFRKNPR
ncbi:hypothetical protein [Azospirillum brasilense]|uniref:Uncharacterized protein n=1 Tax=Azospirillum brasilense TaxID=192 RepID=A0A6L3B3I3_AZOBR|nr:hypothetical protein [Azospirillum brasilense]KAA0687163.1 hypothetical protein DS837_08060 [Azospirillum brasilense]